MSNISMKGLVKAYGDNQVLHNVDAEINPGELVVVVGASGCGKSTLLRMVAGLETITSGDLEIGGRLVNDLEPAERDIAMVFQNYALYPHMTVEQNMSYGLKIRGLAKAEIKARVEEAAQLLELSPFLQRKPRQLSGGQRQRVAMGRAIVRQPEVFLFDEPLSKLDAKLRVQMRLEIRALQQRLGVTSIYVTHDQTEAMTVGDRLMVLNKGYVEQFGTPIELYERPQTKYVAGFIGSPSMNFFSVDVAEGHAQFANGVAIEVPTNMVGHACLGLRPEHLQPDPHGPFALRIRMVEHLGATSLLHGVFEGTDQKMTVSLAGLQRAEAGEILHFSSAQENLHLFDDETGKRIEMNEASAALTATIAA